MTTLGARQSGHLREVLAYKKNQQISPNAGLTDQLHKDITFSAKIRQIEISCLLNVFSHATTFGKSTIGCSCQCVSSKPNKTSFVCKLLLSVISPVRVVKH